MVEVFKIINDFDPPIMEDFFLFCENTHNMYNFQTISNESKKTVRYGLETVKYIEDRYSGLIYQKSVKFKILKQTLKHGNVKHVIVGYARTINKI